MEKYWGQVGAFLKQIEPIFTDRDVNGIDIYFVNHYDRDYNYFKVIGRAGECDGSQNIGQVTGPVDVRESLAGIFNSIKPQGNCRLEHRLSHILDPYMLRLRHDTTIKPMNLILITAGVVKDKPNTPLARTYEMLDNMKTPPYQVGLQFFCIGDDEKGRRAVEVAEDKMDMGEDAAQVIDMVTWNVKPFELSPKTVLDVMLSAVVKAVDKMNA